jgi:hypothetical protein
VVQSRGNEVERPDRALGDFESGPRWSSSSVLDRSKGHDVSVQLESMKVTGLVEWGQGMSMFIWHLVCKQTVDGYERVRLDLEITRGVPSSLCLYGTCGSKSHISHDRF